MKQIRSERLVQRSGRERVYEAEIVETTRESDARYLVNYRYGWAGAELQEGTRTESPVDLATAERLFDSLLQSRRNQGYTDDSSPDPWSAPAAAPAPVSPAASHPRDARLMYLLGHADGMEDGAAAKLVWRIGQVRLAAAAPALATLRHHAGPMTARVLPYALLRCGRGDPEAILPALRALSEHDDPAVAGAARLSLSEMGDPSRERIALLERLPGTVRRALDAGPENGAAQILGYLSIAADAARTPAATLPDDGAAQRDALVDLWMLARHAPELRPLFLSVLDAVPFAPFLFRAIRRIHKAAEAMDDAPTLGALGNRFSLTRANYAADSWSQQYAPGRGHFVRPHEEYERPDARLAWSRGTRNYFRRRMRRHLRRMGEEGDAAYIPVATELLLRIDDDTPGEQAPHHPPHPYRLAENWLLHGAGKRIHAPDGHPVWRWNGYAADSAAREEPNRALWDAAPGALLRLLREGRAEIVRAFAARALADNPDFARTIPVAEIVALLLAGNDAAHGFGLSLARTRLTERGAAEDAPLLPALLRSGRAEAAELARMTMNLKPALATEDGAVTAAILLAAGPHAPWLDDYWRDHAASARDPRLIGHLHDLLQGEPWEEDALDADKARMRRVAEMLTAHFQRTVRAAPKDDILALSRLPAVPPKLLAVLLAAARPDGIETFDPRALASEDDPDLQAAGAELLAGADLEALAGNEDLILAFLAAASDRSREAALTAARRLAEHDPQGAAPRLAAGILDILYRAEDHDGAREDAVRAAAITPIRDALLREGPGRVWSLLRARAEPARRVGAGLLETLDADAFTLRKTARIGLNDQVRARRWAVNALEARLPEIQQKPEEIFALLDGTWDDSREAAYALIRENLDPAQWEPETVVALCDCVTIPAQRFGRETLARAFDDGKAALFLRRLSEHPAPGFRLTVARLIREYAGGDPDRLRELEPALRTILSRVFSSRAAKNQATAFIEEEIARGDPRSLDILGGLLGRVSATCAVGDRARILELIVRIKGTDPALVPEATVIEPEIRQAGGAR